MGGGLLVDVVVHSSRELGEARAAIPRAATLTAALHPRRRIQCCPDGPTIVGGGFLRDVMAHSSRDLEDPRVDLNDR